eukprot:COSAG05_NODE_9018_length_654_cov_1.127928_1_plen_34_part_01
MSLLAFYDWKVMVHDIILLLLFIIITILSYGYNS